MSEVKWIKIKTDIFDDEKMYIIETQQDGQLMELVWFKVLCLAGKCNNHGFLMINNKIAYTDEMLSKVFRMEIGTIQRALNLFQALEMIEVVDNTYMVSNWDFHQNQKGLEELRENARIRQQRHRKKVRDNLKKIRAGETCVYCGGAYEELDHIIPKARGGSDNSINLVPSCHRCNNSKSSYDVINLLNWQDYIKKESVLECEQLMNLLDYDGDKFYWKPEAFDIMSQKGYVTQPVTLQRNVICSYSISNSKELDDINNNNINNYDSNVLDKSNNTKEYKESINNIINILNNRAGTNYRPTTKKTQSLITARLKEGYTVDDFETVIDKKCNEWLGTEHEKYLRPETLFGTKFEGYLNQHIIVDKPTNKGEIDWDNV